VTTDGIPTPKRIREIWKRLTPEQRKANPADIADMVAEYERSQFKLIAGGRRSTRKKKSFAAIRSAIRSIL
jgi:hypothetical protein